MKLTAWRGVNVLITDRAGMPVLKLDANGNLEETAPNGVNGQEEAPASVRSLDRLAAKVAIWIEWTAIEPGEFRTGDIHPDIREQVAAIAEDLVDCNDDELE